MYRDKDGLSSFDRLLPEKGIRVHPDVWYHDVNDIPRGLRITTKQYFKLDKQYHALINSVPIPLGNERGTRYCVYVFRMGQQVGNVVFQEYLDNPHGYGEKDFFFHKWIFEEFRHTKYSRYAMSDIMHMLFLSGVANKLYCWLPCRDEGETLRERANPDLPCRGVKYATDGPEIQKYLLYKELFRVPGEKDRVLLEFNRDIYMTMDLKSYMMTPPHRTEEVVDRWLLEMNSAAIEVREQITGRRFLHGPISG